MRLILRCDHKEKDGSRCPWDAWYMWQDRRRIHVTCKQHTPVNRKARADTFQGAIKIFGRTTEIGG